MQPIRHFLTFREAASRLRKKSSFRWKVHYLAQLLNTAHIIKANKYSMVLSDIFRDGMASTTSRKRLQFTTLSVTEIINLLAIDLANDYYLPYYFIIELAQLFEKSSAIEMLLLTKRFEGNPQIQKLLHELNPMLQSIGSKIDLRSIVQLVKMYYGKKSILFKEEA